MLIIPAVYRGCNSKLEDQILISQINLLLTFLHSYVKQTKIVIVFVIIIECIIYFLKGPLIKHSCLNSLK